MRNIFAKLGSSTVALTLSLSLLSCILTSGCQSDTSQASSTPASTPKPKTAEEIKKEKQQRIQAAFVESNRLTKSGKYEEALSVLRDVKPTDPSRVLPRIASIKKTGSAKLLQVATSSRRKNPEAALEKLKRAAALGSNEATAMIPRVKREIADREERARVAAQRAQVAKEREEMKYFSGEGDVQIAIARVNLKQSTDQHVAGRNATFVYIGIGAKNVGSRMVHVNPNDFTLTDQEGNTVSPETDTYGLDNYFDAVNLRPNQQAGGWLIFYIRKDTRYKLNHQSMYSETQKDIII